MASALGQSGANPGIDVTSEPYYHLLLDNDRVRVFRVEIPAGKSTQLHWHDYGYMTVTLEDSTVHELIMRPATTEDARAHILSKGDMATYELKKKFGDAWRTPPGILHTLSNDSEKMYRNVTFEIKEGHPTVADGEAIALRSGESESHDWTKTDHLLVAMVDCELVDKVDDKTRTIPLKKGDALWIPRGDKHNFGAGATKPVLITSYEFKS